MTRLRWKLFAAMVALAVLTIAISALFARRVTHDQVHRLLRPGGDNGIDTAALEARARGMDRWRDIAQVAGDHSIVLLGPDDRVLATSDDLRDAMLAVSPEGLVATMMRDGRRVELRIRAAPRTILNAAGEPARVFAIPRIELDTVRELDAVDRRLLASFAIVLVVALGLTLVVSRRITRPIEQLTAALRDVGRGRPAARIAVAGRDELADLATSFNAMADAVAAQQALRRRMVGDIAHELRTPLTNLRCELEAAQDGLAVLDAARVGSLHEEVLHLQHLVDELQDLALADAGELVLRRERVELGDAIARIVGDRADVRIADTLFVDVDRVRLRQIVHNLVVNAARHSPVQIVVARAGDDASVAVIDRGPGIAAAHLERIFERLYRVDDARGRADGGAGLGLAIVRRLVELHGGRVWAESVEGEGATFTFTLPASSDPHTRAPS